METPCLFAAQKGGGAPGGAPNRAPHHELKQDNPLLFFKLVRQRASAARCRGRPCRATPTGPEVAVTHVHRAGCAAKQQWHGTSIPGRVAPPALLAPAGCAALGSLLPAASPWAHKSHGSSTSRPAPSAPLAAPAALPPPHTSWLLPTAGP